MAKDEIIIPVRFEITEGSSGGDSGTPMATPGGGGGIAPGTPKANEGGGLGKVIAINAVRQAGQFALSNYGNFTGDYQTQANIQGGLELLGLGAMALSGPVGFASAVGSLVLKGINNQTEVYKKNLATELLRYRTGMSSFSGGR